MSYVQCHRPALQDKYRKTERDRLATTEISVLLIALRRPWWAPVLLERQHSRGVGTVEAVLDHGVQSWLLGLRYDPSAYEEAAQRATAAGGGVISSDMADFMRTKFTLAPISAVSRFPLLSVSHAHNMTEVLSLEEAGPPNAVRRSS